MNFLNSQHAYTNLKGYYEHFLLKYTVKIYYITKCTTGYFLPFFSLPPKKSGNKRSIRLGCKTGLKPLFLGIQSFFTDDILPLTKHEFLDTNKFVQSSPKKKCI